VNLGTIIIAEAGVNHNGDIKIAKKLIEVAAGVGADLVKFQTFCADKLVTTETRKAAYQIEATDDQESQYQMLRRLELSPEIHRELIEHCARFGIGFFSTGFDIESIDFLMSLKQDRIKIPSGEITNLPYLRHIGQIGKPVILSTGMATLGEIEDAINVLEQAGTSRELLTVLHCTTEYPAPMADVNLRAMQSIRNAFRVKVGYSDHTLGIEVAIAAVALGACIIEKHFTLDKDMLGPDHRASLEPMEFRAMVNAIRNLEIAMGDGIKRVAPSELLNRPIARKSLVASKAISNGTLFSPENLGTKRVGGGISPMRWDEAVGRTATRNFSVDEPIEF
jgi:N,N'-diacetyllegionaminate synthase